jgi:hypothetical protein
VAIKDPDNPSFCFAGELQEFDMSRNIKEPPVKVNRQSSKDRRLNKQCKEFIP